MTLTVAKEPPQVAVPDVIGADANDARSARCSSAGFEVDQQTQDVDTPDERRHRLAQDPAGGKAQEGLRRVTITVGSFDPAAEPRPTTDRPRPRRATPPRRRREGRRPRRRALLRARRLAGQRRLGARGRCARPGHEVLDVRARRATAPGARRRGARAAARPRAARRRRRVPGRCTARSARTAPSRGCSSCSTSPYVGSGVLASAVCMDKVALQGADGGAPGCRRCGYVGRSTALAADRARATSRELGLPVLGQAGAAGLVGRHRPRRRAPTSSPAALEPRVRPRRAA